VEGCSGSTGTIISLQAEQMDTLGDKCLGQPGSG